MALALRTMVPGNFLAGIGVRGQRRTIAIVDRIRVDLGDRDINAQLAGRIHMKQLARIARPGAGVNEVANVGVARGNDAIERSNDALVALELFEAAYVGLAGVHRGLRSDVIGAGLIGLLLRDGVLGEQRLPAVAGDFGEVRVGLHALQFGARLIAAADQLQASRWWRGDCLCARARQCRSTTSSGSRWCASRWACQ